MQLGISSYTFGWAVGVPGHPPAHPLDHQGLLDRCRQLGVNLLQVGDNLPLHTLTESRLDRFARAARETGVRLEVGARGLTLEHVTTYAGIARRVGATLVRFVIDDADHHPSPERVISLLRQAAPVLEGLTLGIENHDRFSAATLRTVIEEAGCDHIGICLDTANSLGAGEGIEAVAAELAPLTVNLHIKDFQVERVPHGMGFGVSGRPAGGGLLDLPPLLDRLRPFHRCHTAVLELWTPPEPQLAQTVAKEAGWAVQSMNYLRPLFPINP